MGALLRAHPRARKVVFVPRVQLGQALEQAVSLRCTGDEQAWGGLSCLLVRHYAERLATKHILRSDARELQPAAHRFLAVRLASDSVGDPSSVLPAPAHLAGSVAEAIRSLRVEGFDAGGLTQRVAGGNDVPPALRMVARCYSRYERTLEEENLYDDAAVLGWAIEALEDAPPGKVEEIVFAVIGDTELSALEAELVGALRERGKDFYRIGARKPGADAPAQMAAARYRQVALPGTARMSAGGGDERAPAGEARGERTVCRAVGAENEVRAAFQSILSGGTAFDDVEIALAESSPYQDIVADVAAQARVDVTFSTGRPALQTRTGQALRGLYEWIREGFEPALLIRLLRGGLIRLDREQKRLGADGEWCAPELATWLAGRRYERGRRGYRRAFSVAHEDLEAKITRLEEKGIGVERERGQMQRLEAARQLVFGLLDLVPQGPTSAGEMAHMSQRFLERFGPVDAPAEDGPEEERMLEETARRVLYQKLGNLRDMPVAYATAPGRLAGMFQEVVETQYVQSERPRAGALHVVPLERAAFGGRSHLYVLGLSSEAFAAPETDGALLGELERTLGAGEEEPSGEQECTAARRQEAGNVAPWLARRALERHPGAASLFASVYDVENGEERFPASFFLEREDQDSREPPLACFMPSRESQFAEEGGGVLADERTSWLAAHAAGPPEVLEGGAESGPPSGREAACDQFAWLAPAAAATSLAKHSEAEAPHLIYVPERPLARDHFLEDIQRTYDAHG